MCILQTHHLTSNLAKQTVVVFNVFNVYSVAVHIEIYVYCTYNLIPLFADIWRWLVVAFCVIVLFVIGIMVILLCKRKKGKRQRRKQFYKHDLSTTSGITPSNLSSFPESSVEF